MILRVSLTGILYITICRLYNNHIVHYNIVCRQLIYNYPEQLFADASVMAIEHADFEGIERLALVLGNAMASYYVHECLSCVRVLRYLVNSFFGGTGGEIVSTFGNPEKVKLGRCKLIEEVMIGEDKVDVIYIYI